ncbi:Auxin response factor [Parasponia andersonii]|uniref:Auxin response factor n=1 Tax=Parasponia andersonii TaxID=3476 RepID=A0A2P5C810_PARAD|nr:Auxin response factor [Parasponia andersonii]
MPIYNLPSKILCKVVYIELKAEAQTDEVFAQITLLPLTEDELSSEDEDILPMPQRTRVFSFSKTLTPSDTSTHGGFSVPKRHADECFPKLDMLQQPPVQELVAKDLHGFEWHFRHIYRGQPKRHLLTSGENGELRVGVHHAMKRRTPNNVSTSVISGHSMQHGILASALHSISTGTLFTVYYRPWTSPAEFIIPCDEFMKSTENDYLPGTKFGFVFEGEEYIEKRLSGIIVGVEDHDGMRWPSSEWRCLKVQWDAQLNTTMLPGRLSPWNIKPVDSTNKTETVVRPPPKRGHELDLPTPGFSSLAREGLLLNRVKRTPQRHKEVLQGQETSDIRGHESGVRIQTISPRYILPPDPDWKQTQLQFENQLHFPCYQCPGEEIPFPGETRVTTGLTNPCCSTFATYGVCESVAFTGSFSVSNGNSSNSESQECTAFKQRSDDIAPRYPNGCDKYMLFGVNLFHSHPELPSPQVATSSELLSTFSFPPTSQSSSVSEPVQVSDTSKSVSDVVLEKQCKQCCSISNRSCTKVLKHGTALGRSVDLTHFDGYEELISELDQMFDFKGSLTDGSSEWQVTYMNDEGDWILVGDYEWQAFRSAVRRMIICPKDEINKLNPGSLNPVSI